MEEIMLSEIRKQISKEIDEEINEKVLDFARELTDRKDKYIAEIMKGIKNMAGYISKQNIKDKLDYFKKMGKDIHGHYYYEEEIELLQGLLEEE